MGQPDPKNAPRIRNPQLLREMQLVGGTCVLCGDPRASLHHILKRSQGGDDVAANLVWLCGDGVSGCHGMIEAEEEMTRHELGVYLVSKRPDVVVYMQMKLQQGAAEWFRRRLLVVI